MPGKPIFIDVLKMDGNSTTVGVDRQTTVLHLKYKLTELWDVPPESQKLIHGGDVLDNTRFLSSLHKTKGSKLSVFCVISGEGVFACLENSNSSPSEWLSALRALPDMAYLDYERAFNIFRASLHGPARVRLHVREAATEGLLKILQTGGNDVAASVLKIAQEGLQHPDDMVRSSSVELLCHSASKEDASVLIDIFKLLGTDPSYMVRREAAKAISIVAPAGDESALKALLAFFSDKEDVVREAAARSLGELLKHAETSNCEVAALMRLANYEQPHVQEEAWQVFTTCMPAKAKALAVC